MQRLYFQLLLSFSVIVGRPFMVVAGSFPLVTPTYRVFTTDNLKQATESNESENLFQQLNLTSQQKRKISQIRHQYQAQIVRLKEDLKIAQQQLAAMLAGTDSVTTIRAKHEEISKFRHQLATLHFESILATREILTPQQRQKFAEIIEARD